MLAAVKFGTSFSAKLISGSAHRLAGHHGSSIGNMAKTEKDDRSGKGLLALARTDDEFSSGLHSTMSFHHHWTPLELDHLEDHEFSSTNIIGLHWTVT